MVSQQLGEWIREQLKAHRIHRFYYFSLCDNFESVLRNGILSRNEVVRQKLQSSSFANQAVQDIRHQKRVQLTDRSWHGIHDLVPVYLAPLTPTLYAVKDRQNDLFFAEIESFVCADESIAFAFTDGNAASQATSFYWSLRNLEKINLHVFRSHTWTDFPDGSRIRNAEFLLNPRVPSRRIRRFVVRQESSREHLASIIRRCRMHKEVQVDPLFFF